MVPGSWIEKAQRAEIAAQKAFDKEADEPQHDATDQEMPQAEATRADSPDIDKEYFEEEPVWTATEPTETEATETPQKLISARPKSILRKPAATTSTVASSANQDHRVSFSGGGKQDCPIGGKIKEGEAQRCPGQSKGKGAGKNHGKYRGKYRGFGKGSGCSSNGRDGGKGDNCGGKSRAKQGGGSSRECGKGFNTGGKSRAKQEEPVGPKATLSPNRLQQWRLASQQASALGQQAARTVSNVGPRQPSVSPPQAASKSRARTTLTAPM